MVTAGTDPPPAGAPGSPPRRASAADAALDAILAAADPCWLLDEPRGPRLCDGELAGLLQSCMDV